ncbi:MAG TPA: hypothetical protein GX010_01675 [Erysipelotrichaceae bacterium]|nr:hypothetical protein [Erysipelotrichaceae bacterium]
MKKIMIVFGLSSLLFISTPSTPHITNKTSKNASVATSLKIPQKRNTISDNQSSNCYNISLEKGEIEFNIHDVLSEKNTYLQNMLTAFDDETDEYEKITKLCSVTERCIANCNPEQVTSLREIAELARNSDFLGTRSTDDVIVIGALAYFALNKYDLSYELLAHAFDDVVEQSPNYYVPVHGYRVFQSDLTYLIANDPSNTPLGFIANNPELEGTYIFDDGNGAKNIRYPSIGNSYEQDLRFAIQTFDFTKTNKKVTIKDRYDFEPNKFDGLEGYVINYLYSLQLQEILKVYDFRITYDFSHFLRLKTINKSNSVWTIEVKNPNPAPVEFIYNKKMCHFDDAKNWTNLIDVSYKTVLGNSTEIVTISENLVATSVSFSFFNGSTKYMIYGDGLSDNGMIDFRINQKVQTYNSRIRLMGKDGNKWLIKLKNTTSNQMLVEYNIKMCFHSDAQNWTGLLDLTDFYMQAGETSYIYISENGTATSIAITLSGQTLNCSYYANNLSTSGTMSLNSSSRSSRIRIENKGKSGAKWNIRVKNPTNYNITVHYNCKMCFENDAKNWTALGNNERNVVVEPHHYVDIQISENWFATHITLSYISGSMRYITYANELSTNKSIHIYWNTKSA